MSSSRPETPELIEQGTLARVRQVYGRLDEIPGGLSAARRAQPINKLYLKGIERNHDLQYRDDGDPVVFATVNAQGLKLPCYRWTPEVAMGPTPPSISEVSEPLPGRHIVRSNNWRPVNWQHANGAIFYIHGIADHSRFELLAMRKMAGAIDVSTTKRISELQQSHLTRDVQESLGEETFQDSWAQRITESGFVLYAPDQEAHGLAQAWTGQRCNVKRFTDLVNDGISWLEMLVNCGELSNSVPIFLAGLSMGGATALRVLQTGFSANRFLCDSKTRPIGVSSSKPILRGALLFCPAIATERLQDKPSNKIKVHCGPFCSRFFPHLPAAALQQNLMFPYINELVQRDCMVRHTPIPARLGWEVVQVARLAKKGYDHVPAELSMFLCQSALDTMTDPEGSEYYMRHSHSEDKTTIFIDYGWHYLFKEPGYLLTIDLAINWMMERV